ncbi:Uncharacterised protein [uncultured archaeon]|nr:Uncharacterised protein [uncultured archaeon]
MQLNFPKNPQDDEFLDDIEDESYEEDEEDYPLNQQNYSYDPFWDAIPSEDDNSLDK